MTDCGLQPTIRAVGQDPSVRFSLMRRQIASVFGVGFVLGRLRGSHSGSGTLGAAVGVGLAMTAGGAGWLAQLVLALVLTLASVWSSHPFSDDPGWVVIDEAAGASLAVIGLGPTGMVTGWVVFRIVDIVKRGFPGMKAAERLPAGWGITGDDVVAGGYGLALGWIVQLWLS